MAKVNFRRWRMERLRKLYFSLLAKPAGLVAFTRLSQDGLASSHVIFADGEELAASIQA